MVESFSGDDNNQDLASISFETQSKSKLPDYIQPVLYYSAQPKFSLKKEIPIKDPKSEAPPEKKTLINSVTELYKLNPMTLKSSIVSSRDLFLTIIDNDRNRPDSLYYYLPFVDFANKVEVDPANQVKALQTKLHKWDNFNSHPLSCLGLFSPSWCCTFLQLHALELVATHFRDDLIKALIPFFVGFLAHSPQVVSPVSEYLVELACKYPLAMGREIAWNILSLPKFMLKRAVYYQLFREIMRVCPSLRQQILLESSTMRHIQSFITVTNDQAKVG